MIGADDVRGLVEAGVAWIAAQPGGAIGAVAAVAIGGMVFVPVTILAAAVIAVFGAWPGIFIAWSGAMVGALGSHALGARLRPMFATWLSGPRATRAAVITRFLDRRAFFAVVLMRVLPVGNFGVWNLLAGAMKISRRAFVLGNAVGLLPNLLGVGLLVNRIVAVLRQPTATNVVVVVIVAATALVAAAVAVVFRRRLAQRAFGGTNADCASNAAMSSAAK
jgi:phospholipase D1/2